jgi:hypothetical protein
MHFVVFFKILVIATSSQKDVELLTNHLILLFCELRQGDGATLG